MYVWAHMCVRGASLAHLQLSVDQWGYWFRKKGRQKWILIHTGTLQCVGIFFFFCTCVTVCVCVHACVCLSMFVLFVSGSLPVYMMYIQMKGLVTPHWSQGCCSCISVCVCVSGCYVCLCVCTHVCVPKKGDVLGRGALITRLRWLGTLHVIPKCVFLCMFVCVCVSLCERHSWICTCVVRHTKRKTLFSCAALIDLQVLPRLTSSDPLIATMI